MHPLARGLVAAALGLAASHAHASPPASARVVVRGLVDPAAIAAAPGDAHHLFIAGLLGPIRVVDLDAGAVLPTPFLDLTTTIAHAGDGGLLGLAFDPGYAANGFFYVFYNARPDPPSDRVLARYHCTPGSLAADPGSGVILWQFPRTFGHNGGWIGFSPLDGLLYLSTGDGGVTDGYDFSNHAQNLSTSYLGKLLRIDVAGGDDFPSDPLRNYHVPPTNPFVGGTEPEVWAYGLRNPWRCSFDRQTGDLYIADVGEAAYEELDFEPAGSPGGRDYGWPCMEGAHCTTRTDPCVCGSPGLASPIFEYGHDTGHSITGGYVYRGAAIPGLQGRYLFADFADSRVFSLRVQAGSAQELVEHTTQLTLPSARPITLVSTFGEDAAGELYLTDFFSGTLYKLVPFVCWADVNHDGAVSTQDIFDMLAAWFANGSGADFNGDGAASIQDIFDFLTLWFAGCA